MGNERQVWHHKERGDCPIYHAGKCGLCLWSSCPAGNPPLAWKTECKHKPLGRVQTVCPTSMEYIQLPKRKKTNSQEMLFKNVVGVDNLQTLFVFVAAITIILRTGVASESTKIPKVFTNPWCCSSRFSLHSTVDHSHTFPKNNLEEGHVRRFP